MLDDLINSGFANLSLIESLYVKFQTDPHSVPSEWKDLFSQLEEKYRTTAVPLPMAEPTFKNVAIIDQYAPPDLRIYHLIQAYRTYGHLMAKTNPIAIADSQVPWQLSFKKLGFKKDELTRLFPTNGLLQEENATLEEIIHVLQEIYCGNIGVEYMGVQNPELEQWLQTHVEPSRFKIDLTIEQKKMILHELNKSELFESFLHTKYVGQKRFSLEGGETLIPILQAVIEKGATLGMKQFVIGMAHRGRLNVLSNILKKSYSQIFSEFEEGYIPLSFEGSGDVKYHKGFLSTIEVLQGKTLDVILTPNPSHLEAVDPVVQGQARAMQVKENDSKTSALPILIHGDAAISGQGVVYETMQLYDLEGYSTGGTVHIVINNQIGFTTLPQDSRSTHYCTDIARTFKAPVFHVNAEDPEACVFATILAVEMRKIFRCDVFIDLICYRKYGHNEADEPAFTQPLEYQLIRKKRPIREIYRDSLIRQGVLERKMAEELEEEFKKSLQKDLVITRDPDEIKEKERDQAIRLKEDEELFLTTKTQVTDAILQKIGKKLAEIPEGFSIHKKLERQIQERLEMTQGKRAVDWGMGETLAYATLLMEGKSVRISGQDSCRGTFSHRHALWMDQKEEKAYYPLKNLDANQGRFAIYNSPLSEFAVLGFEFGFSIASKDTLVIWEAQFGDFCNGAQVIIDQFLSTSEMKWGQKSSLVLFLPHGYEGQGPEHSSARMERFLTLCGDKNMQIVNPTLPAQLFHLLRRQLVKPINKPLIVFTPKGLLRYKECVSAIKDFSQGTFQEILDDTNAPKKVKTLVFCSGRVFYDLSLEREKREQKEMAIVRIEQLYPLHKNRVQEIIEKYRGFKHCYWVQEEPRNMGAWNYVRPRLKKQLPKKIELQYIGRPRRASPAAGSYALDRRELKEMMEALFDEA